VGMLSLEHQPKVIPGKIPVVMYQAKKSALDIIIPVLDCYESFLKKYSIPNTWHILCWKPL
jgi:hypothetical protein